MANLAVKNAAADTKYMKTAGAGTDEDPHIPEHTISGTVQLAAGTNGIGKLTANSGVDIGDVDVASLPALAAGSNLIGKVSIDQVTANANEVVVKSITAGSNAIGKLAANSGVDIGDVDVTSLPALAAGTNFIGASAPPSVTVDVTLSLDTNAYTAGDVLAATQEVAGAARANGAGVELVSMLVRDKDDQTAAAMTFYFFDDNTALGTENSAPDIDDTEIDTLVGLITIPASAWIDLGGVKVANMSNIGLLMHPGAASTSLYIAATTAGTPTQSASGITVTLQFIRY